MKSRILWLLKAITVEPVRCSESKAVGLGKPTTYAKYVKIVKWRFTGDSYTCLFDAGCRSSWTLKTTYNLMCRRHWIISIKFPVWLRVTDSHLTESVAEYQPIAYAVITIAIRLRYDYDPTTVRLRRIARACFHSTRLDASKKWTCQFFVVVVS